MRTVRALLVSPKSKASGVISSFAGSGTGGFEGGGFEGGGFEGGGFEGGGGDVGGFCASLLALTNAVAEPPFEAIWILERLLPTEGILFRSTRTLTGALWLCGGTWPELTERYTHSDCAAPLHWSG
jgi:hypothetical protein